MAILRVNDIKKLNDTEQLGKLTELRKELLKAKTQSTTGNQKVGKIREIKRTIARILTIQGGRIKTKA